MLRRLYDWTLAKAAHPQAEWWLAMFAFIEASFFPIPPHPLLGLMCLAEPKKAIRFAVIATLASVAGGLLGYAIGWGLYDTVGTELLALLGMTESFPVAACYLREYGAEIIMIKGATPIPFKLLTITAGSASMSLVPFTIACIIGRGLRFFGVAGVFWLIGPKAVPFIDKYFNLLCIIFAVLLIGGFVVIKYMS